SNIKTIVFTANLSKDITKELIKIGVFDYLNKPIDMNSIISSLNRAILFTKNEAELKEENIYHLESNVDVSDGIKNSLLGMKKGVRPHIETFLKNTVNLYFITFIFKRDNLFYY
ncbi:MAG: hypothetical protein U9Q20_05670, partial [Campylobacterota bacterium]|nr:hypothetical protein [Campylobacterota bacterium]